MSLALEHHAEVDTFPCHIVVQSECIPRECVSEIITVVLIDLAVPVAVLVLHVTRLELVPRPTGTAEFAISS